MRAHKTGLAALDAGKWPKGPAGERIAALAERLGPESAAKIRDYWRTLSLLVVEAEEAMIEESAGDVVFDRSKVAAAFADLARLRGELGKSGFAALKPLLPFSRNDYWEVSELRQRLGEKALTGRVS